MLLLLVLTVLGIAARNGILLVRHYAHLRGVEEMPFGRELILRGAGTPHPQEMGRIQLKLGEMATRVEAFSELPSLPVKARSV